MPILTVQIPGEEPQAYEFDEPHVTIGRSDENSIVIPHDSLSTSHAQLKRNDDGSYQLMDLGSTNGTYVDGQEINDVQLGDTAGLAFGQVTAYWQISAEAGADAQAEAGAQAEAPDAAMQPAAAEGFQLGEFAPMGRPPNFHSISPHGKVKKKDPMASVAILLGLVSLAASIALVGAVLVFLK